MRSVPLPLLDGLDFMYHPGIRLLKCTECNIFVPPRSAASHSANIHWYIMAAPTRKQLERDFPNPSWTKPFPLVPFGEALPPIDDLPIVRGWMCVVDECGFISDSRKSVDAHTVNKHHRAAEEQCVNEVNATRLVTGNPQIWIPVNGQVTPPGPSVKRGASSSPVKSESYLSPREAVDDLSTSTTAVDGFIPQRTSHTPPPPTRQKPLNQTSNERPAYPTLEQFLQPCTRHPTLDATGSPMLLHPGINLIKCGTCHTFLLPSQTPGHFRSSHETNTRRSQPWSAIPRAFPDPHWIRPFPELAVGDGFPPIAGLPVVPAFQCAYDDCGTICSSMYTLKSHFTTSHPKTPYAGQFLEVKASKFMITSERQNVWIPIAGEADESDSPRAAATPAGRKSQVQTPRQDSPPGARRRQPSARKTATVSVAPERLPSPPANSHKTAPSGSRKRKRVEDPDTGTGSRTCPTLCFP